MRNPKHDADFYREWWLKKYHNITVEEVVEKYPEEIKSPDWFKLFPCTEKQYDEWKEWAIKEAAKDNGISLKWAKKHFWSIELNCAPYVEPNNNL